MLLETLLALAVFATAVAFCYAALRSARSGIDRAQRLAIATEIAATRLAEIESGALGASALRDATDGIDRLGSEDFRERRVGGDDELPFDGFTIEVDVERSDFEGLSLVTVTVQEVDDDAGLVARPQDAMPGGEEAFDADPPIRVVLRQLLRVAEGAEEGFEEDPILDDLPESDGGAGAGFGGGATP